ncbi:serine protease [Mesorhizobium sp.]|uniref:serine protease n=1 Tax=Mesorhizobium sp. TaxID=1871066 RepID=UPI000FE6F8AD|nr:serine protease [Mesorhizobium sp.]RWP58165.1 MAG: serine protease [Mesorhizobium sp.]
MPAGPKATSQTKATRTGLYAARRYLTRDAQRELKLRIPFDAYFQDPTVRVRNPVLEYDESFEVPWEPGIGDGPTSARFAVVDYDASTEILTPPAEWNADKNAFVGPGGATLDQANVDSPQYRQVNVWATLQNALEFYENGFGLGRPIPFAFEGNRLIVVPTAGYGQNAYYDRQSKSLQFYYFDSGEKRIYTCLSADIINHEFGHAVLDGLRPLLSESIRAETAAFHEFVGDLSAVLIAFRNNKLRQWLAEATGGNLDTDSALSSLAEEFGKAVADQPYLRSALNTLHYDKIKDDQRQHYMSQVLTGAMFDIVRKLAPRYRDGGRSILQAFWYTVSNMQCMAVQPLDLLPPVDVTFEDYAIAVLRNEEIVNPTDSRGTRQLMIDVFQERGILSAEVAEQFRQPHDIFQRLRTDVYHDLADIAGSRSAAYRFLDDNRRNLFIPYSADVAVQGLANASKFTSDARRQPQQVLLQYTWREPVLLDDERFGRFAGETTSMLCGGTLAFDIDGNLLSWMRKPGTQPLIGEDEEDGANTPAEELTAVQTEIRAESEAGRRRKQSFLDALAARIKTGRIGEIAGGQLGILEKTVAPLTAETVDGILRFSLSPHVGIHSDEHEKMGESQWQISS